MQYTKIENGFMIYVEKDEKIMESLTQFCIKKDFLTLIDKLGV